MGRERLLVRAIDENKLARISLREGSGSADLHRELFFLLEGRLNADALLEKELAFRAMDSFAQIKEVGHLFDLILRKRFHIQITESSSLFLDNGSVVPWFAEALNSFAKVSPFCVFVRARRRPYSPRPAWHLEEIQIRDLSLEDMEALLGQLLNESGTPFSSQKIRLAAEKLGGHPLSAYRFAEHARKYGVDASLQNDAIMVQYRELLLADALEEFKLTTDAWKILFVVARYRTVDIVGLSEYTMLPVAAVLPALETLIDSGMLTHSGDLHSLAPFVRPPLERHRAWPLDGNWQAGVDERVARSVETFIDEDFGSSSLLNNAIAANLKTGRASPLLGKLVLGSHLFRVARDLYDGREYAKALELFKEALELRSTLAPEAISEALRFYGLCGARLELEDILDVAISQLNSLDLPTARRNASFLRGFRDRRQHHYQSGYAHYEASLRHGKHLHTYRELAFCALKLDLIPDAKKWAELALRQAQTNAYFLDVMCRVVLREFLETRSQQKEEEFDNFHRRLARACTSSGESFASLRSLERAVALNDVAGVRDAVAAFERSRRYDDIACTLSASSLICDEDISQGIQFLEKVARHDSRKRHDLAALRCLQAVHEGRIDEAVQWVARSRNDWELEAIGIDYALVREKVIRRGKHAMSAGERLLPETIRILRAS
jgi:tetratricopeptide (TPR) repeat protein